MIKGQAANNLVPPDGGWGWMVLAGIALNNLFNMSMLSVFGLLYGDALEAMGHKTQGAALVLNTTYFISIFGGPVAGCMVKLTSPRLVAVSGACICTVAIFSSGFSTNIWHLMISFGVLLGFGMDLISISSFVAINSYFHLKKGRALGLAMVGTGVGQTLMPHLVRYLLENYGFRQTCFLLSALSVQGIAGCMLIEPVEPHMKEVQTGEPIIHVSNEIHENTCSDKIVNEVIRSNGVEEENNGPVIKPYVSNIENLDEPKSTDQSMITMNNSVPEVKLNCIRKFYDLFGFTLLCNIRFINILMGLALSTASIHNFGFLYPFFLEEQVSLDMQLTANCMSALAIADVMGRFLLPILQDKYKIKARWILIITCIWLLIIRQILAYQKNVLIVMIMSAFYGFGRSMIIVQRNLAISENCKMDQVPLAVGLGKFSNGAIALPLGYFLGWIRDYTGSYISCITAQNALLVILLVTWIPDMLCVYIKESNEGKVDAQIIP